jgi:uncharacterized glyoxalase superfamily protein PhnB
MTPNRSAPRSLITPVLPVEDVRAAVAWYVDVLGLVEHVRIGDGHRAQLGVDGSRAELVVRERRSDEAREAGGAQVMFRVHDVRATLDAARRAGAHGDESPHDHAYGERQAAFVDPFGHAWVLTQTLRDVDPEEWGGTTVVRRR